MDKRACESAGSRYFGFVGAVWKSRVFDYDYDKGEYLHFEDLVSFTPKTRVPSASVIELSERVKVRVREFIFDNSNPD